LELVGKEGSLAALGGWVQCQGHVRVGLINQVIHNPAQK
jgi:hypothetical protein